MISIPYRAQMVFDEAWKLLPPIKNELLGELSWHLEDLGAVHGRYSPEEQTIAINERLFYGDNPMQIMCIDVHGQCPPRSYPHCSRALHTTIHELFHALGNYTGADDTPQWHALSGWVQSEKDATLGTGRYHENRPGWEQGPSEWRYRTGNTWFVREYSTKSPYEDFADAATHIALGWADFFGENGFKKLVYLREKLWKETGEQFILAARERWGRYMQGVV